jgi:hypothetical protein
MHRIGRDGLIVNWKPCDPDDTVVLAYGEVDCRGHIGKQISLGRNEDDIITELTSEYIRTVARIVRAHVVIVAVIPPTTNAEYRNENPSGGFPFVSSDDDRVRYTKKVNQSLASLCLQHNFVFFDPYAPYTREDGCLRRELSDGNVHIGDTTHVLSQFRPAFVIPVYPGDFHRLAFLKSLPVNREFDVVLVLTYREDAETLDRSNVDVVLFLEDFISRELIDVVSRKKIHAIVKTYYALHSLKSRYTYFACVDCEVLFKNCVSLFAKFAKRYSDGLIVGSTLAPANTHEYETVLTINRNSAVYFTNEELPKLVNDFRFYSWFSDIPLYRSDTIDEFLSSVGFNDTSLFIEKTVANFHSIPYSYYRILRKDARILDVKTVGINREWSLECMPEQTYTKVCNAGYTPLWVVNAIYNSSMSTCVMTYHCDRTYHFFGRD